MSKKTNKHKHSRFNVTKEYLENIISLMPGHVYWKDRNCILLGCNDLQAKSAGLSSRYEIVGKTDYDMPWKEQADALRKTDLKVMKTGTPKTIEEISRLAGGKKAIFLTKKVPLRNKQGKIIGLLGISFDITEQKRAKKKLMETKLKLEGMTAISSSVAHELRTPLATLNLKKDQLKQYLPQLLEAYQMAQTAGLPVKPINKDVFLHLNKSVEVIDHEIRSALTFIDMLLMNLKPTISQKSDEVFSLRECVNEAIMRYPFESGEKELLHLKLGMDFSVKAKKILIIHLFFNLLKNALYYIAAAGKGEITIWFEPEKDYNKVYFQDTGMGISSAALPKIFDRFFTQTLHGAGVGLTYCKMVMRSLGGKIACESIEGEYTRFILFFPKVK